MTLQRLRTFVVVGKHLNLRKAAELVRVRQPTVSQRLKLLEQELGKKLYMKSAKGVKLTDDGRLLLKDAEAALLPLDRLIEKTANRSIETETRFFAVDGTYGPSAVLLPSAMAVFNKKHPGVEVNLVTASQRAIEEKVLRGDVKIAVVSGVDPPLQLTSEPYSTMESMAFVATDHAIVKKKKLGKLCLGDLAQTPLILRGG